MKKQYHNQQTFDIFLDPSKITNKSGNQYIFDQNMQNRKQINFLNFTKTPYNIISLNKH